MANKKQGEKSSGATAAAAPLVPDEIPPPPPGEVSLHHGLTVIEVSDPADLTALLANSRIAPLVLARIGPTSAVVSPKSAPRLLLALAKAGHTPNVIGEP